MTPTKILDYENNGVCTVVDGDFLYLGSNGIISKYRLEDMALIGSIVIKDKFKKAIYNYLWFKVYEDYVFIIDFCDLHVVKKDDLQLQYTIRLGENVSSDITGFLDFDFPTVYIKIRNGKIDVFDINTKKSMQLEISYTTSWSHCINKNRIYYSTGTGALLELERYSLQELRRVQLTKKMNIYSVVYHNDMLYTTAEQGFRVVDVSTLEIVRHEPKVFSSTEAQILGICGNSFVVVERMKVALFDTQTLQLQDRFDFPTGYRFMRYAVLKGDKLYGSDEHGIYCCTLNR